jgi:hypothetical protein
MLGNADDFCCREPLINENACGDDCMNEISAEHGRPPISSTKIFRSDPRKGFGD